MSFAVGQRWVSQAEFELGLGTVINTDQRFVQVLFPGAEETRQYAIDHAPLMRVEYSPGDKISSLEDFEFIVERAENGADTIVYHGTRLDNGESVAVKEIMLDHHVKLNTPEARLFTGSFDRSHWFTLRYEAHIKKAELETFSLHGLLGARVGLIPHQLYIADTVGKRFAPRVLLADEVGLGKTIEAGMIIHQQLVTGRASRVLVILPASLQHQWLVEMLRRFNLRFSMFDDARCQTESESSSNSNPFDNEQLIFVSHEWLSKNEKWQQQLTSSEWDLVVVDEAHHISPIEPNESASSPEQNQAACRDAHSEALYLAVEKVGRQTKGLILLTATPDQLGHYGHFKRLQLLDPDRFHDYGTYLEEESHYQQIAAIANKLLQHIKLNDEEFELLSLLLSDESNIMRLQQFQLGAITPELVDGLIDDLLDRHGTGRIMFRNSRQAIPGFPERQLFSYALPKPENYFQANEYIGPFPEQQFHPEDASKSWQALDPRVDWLCQFLKATPENKTLVICAHAETAKALDDALFEKEGLRTTVFHEDMSIVERDKAAAYFADSENSAQALICSEIGSEGRNFQFAHQLVLFDLPMNPDLLEQRIGRLDRIGQTETVQIHVPYISDSAQHKQLRLYQEAFNAFEQTSTTARVVFEQMQTDLQNAIVNEIPDDRFDSLIEEAKTLNAKLKLEVEAGRDKLLEINSGGGEKAQRIASQIEEIDDSTELLAFMTQVWEHFGLNIDQRSAFSYVLKPGDHMLTDHFPALVEDGVTACFDRTTALSHEEQQFMSWEHPMTTGVLDMLTASDLGNASVCLLKNKKLPAGTFFLELIFLVTTSAPKRLQLQRFLPNTAIRVMLDKNGNDLADKVKPGSLDSSLKNAKKSISSQLIKAFKENVIELVEQANEIVEVRKNQLVDDAKTQLTNVRQQELDRLLALKEINPAIRNEEIDFLQEQLKLSVSELNSAQIQLDAIRLIVVDNS